MNHSTNQILSLDSHVHTMDWSLLESVIHDFLGEGEARLRI